MDASAAWRRRLRRQAKKIPAHIMQTHCPLFLGEAEHLGRRALMVGGVAFRFGGFHVLILASERFHLSKRRLVRRHAYASSEARRERQDAQSAAEGYIWHFRFPI